MSYRISIVRGEFWVFNGSSELSFIGKTKEEAQRWINKRKLAKKNSVPSPIFSKEALREINKIARGIK